MANNKPKMLAGTMSRHERETREKAMLLKHKRRVRTGITLSMLGVIVIVAAVIGLVYNNKKAPEPINHSVASSSSVLSSSSSVSSSSVITAPKNIFDGVAQEISPSDYIKNVYGKTQALYLIIGNSDDMRTQKLAQLMQAQKANLHVSVPVYYIDANKYLHGHDDQQKIAILQLLNGLGLFKVNGQSVPSDVKFTSTMYANKLTKVDNKAAYKSYTADAQAFTEQKSLLAFFSAANTQLAK